MTRASVSIDGHFGEWIQGRLGPGGPVVLITMPCTRTGVDAHLAAQDDPDGATGAPPATTDIMQRFSAALDIHLAGNVRLVPRVPAGLGTGVSTATLLALADLAQWRGTPDALARACIQAEGASDPLMFPAPERLLWASREGVTYAHLPGLPQFEVVGGFRGGPSRTDARDNDFPDIADLVGAWRAARHLREFAQLASESARRCLALRGRVPDPTAALAAATGALGWNIAHTGAARGLIFAPGTCPPDATDRMRAAGYHGVMRFQGGGAA
ncbi:propanediol utilization protein [Roseinatronobacter alkalisoli]|uniref:Propanediol utilization protein n=1 Tax=Roseinatronobacter alkalisoli TaxID=3028235 RepID=A0ABT5T6V2_9RHOB|nr:propanediol utilization protein [Roseinatronobacter sp. HJB301]MDD7970779.1 propanediol utilization protein [Roseinatronobacter sp. HJB301]